MAGGLGHADDRDGREFAQGQQTGIAETGDEHRVAAVAVLGEGIERGVPGDGGRRAARDVAAAEAAGHRFDLHALPGDPARMAGHQVRDRGRGVRIDEKQAHCCVRLSTGGFPQPAV